MLSVPVFISFDDDEIDIADWRFWSRFKIEPRWEISLFVVGIIICSYTKLLNLRSLVSFISG